MRLLRLTLPWFFTQLTAPVSAMTRLDPANERSVAELNKPLIFNEDAGVAYYGYRYYNPVNGRWINRDPIGERGGAVFTQWAGASGLKTH